MRPLPLFVLLLVFYLLAGCLEWKAQPIQPATPVAEEPAPAAEPAPVVQSPISAPPQEATTQPSPSAGQPQVLPDNPLGFGFGLNPAGMATRWEKPCASDSDCESLWTQCELYACRESVCQQTVKAC